MRFKFVNSSLTLIDLMHTDCPLLIILYDMSTNTDSPLSNVIVSKRRDKTKSLEAIHLYSGDIDYGVPSDLGHFFVMHSNI